MLHLQKGMFTNMTPPRSARVQGVGHDFFPPKHGTNRLRGYFWTWPWLLLTPLKNVFNFLVASWKAQLDFNQKAQVYKDSLPNSNELAMPHEIGCSIRLRTRAEGRVCASRTSPGCTCPTPRQKTGGTSSVRSKSLGATQGLTS